MNAPLTREAERGSTETSDTLFSLRLERHAALARLVIMLGKSTGLHVEARAGCFARLARYPSLTLSGDALAWGAQAAVQAFVRRRRIKARTRQACAEVNALHGHHHKLVASEVSPR